MSISLDPHQARQEVGPDLGQTVCKGYQQMTLAGKGLRLEFYPFKCGSRGGGTGGLDPPPPLENHKLYGFL